MTPNTIAALGSALTDGNPGEPKKVFLPDVNTEIDNLAVSTTAATLWPGTADRTLKALRLVISVDAAVALEITTGIGTWRFTTGVLTPDHTYVFDFGHGIESNLSSGFSIETKSGTANAYGTISGVNL